MGEGSEVTPDTSRAYVVQIPDGEAPATTWTSVHNDVANLFCAGHAFLPDGRLLVVGGQKGSYYFGLAATTIFNYASGYGWETPAGSAMRAPRWYPSAITLASGDILALGGSIIEPDRSQQGARGLAVGSVANLPAVRWDGSRARG